jgi:ribonucleoside-diphosphate reductase alpha chain
MEGIYDTLKNTSVIARGGGGWGINFSKLREEGALVSRTGQGSSGPISFMKVFNTSTDVIKQGGMRRGAAIAILDISHPDILKFIECKDKPGELTNFNISVALDKTFMEYLERDYDWDLRSPATNKIVATIKAKDIWSAICEHAWKTGEPGLLFTDNINYSNSNPYIDKQAHWIEVANPCAEQPMPPNTSCVLGSLNLSSYYKEDGFNSNLFTEDIHNAVRFLDNCIDISPYPLPEIEENTKAERRIGLGIMGWADLLLKMHIKYDSKEAIELAEHIGYILQTESWNASVELTERGVFPNWRETHYGNGDDAVPMRNCTRTTIAPAGTISRIVGCSSGLEPIFSPKIHHKLATIEYDEIHPAWDVDLKFGDGEWLVTAHDIEPKWHIAHVAAWQKYIDSSISKTINLPNTATVSDVESMYKEAYKLGLKGVTIYRDGCRSDQPLTDANEMVTDEEKTAPPIPFLKTKRHRGSIAFGPTHKVQTQQGKAYVTVNYVHEEDDPVEVFIRLGDKATSREHEMAEWCGRLLSLLLKYNVPMADIIRQANKIHGDSPIIYAEEIFSSLPKLVSRMLSLSFQDALNQCNLYDDNGIIFEPDFELDEIEKVIEKQNTGEFCYNCGEYSVVREDGCLHCLNCDWSKCG